MQELLSNHIPLPCDENAFSKWMRRAHALLGWVNLKSSFVFSLIYLYVSIVCVCMWMYFLSLIRPNLLENSQYGVENSLSLVRK